MENKISLDINGANQRLNNLEKQKETVENILLQYKNGKSTQHYLCENYYNLVKCMEEFMGFFNKFRENLEKSRVNSAASDAQYYAAKKLDVRILEQITKVQNLSNRVKAELNITTQTSSNYASSPETLIDIEQGKAHLQFQDQQQQKLEIEDADQVLQDMQRIDNGISKINEMFTSLAGFVHEQGELTDRIEANVELAYNQVDSGNQQLNKAVGHKRSAVKKRICIIGIVLIVVLILILIFYFSFRQ